MNEYEMTRTDKLSKNPQTITAASNLSYPQLKHLAPSNLAMEINVLFQNLIEKKEDKFIKDFLYYYNNTNDKGNLFRKDNTHHTLLQLAVDQGLKNCVKTLLDKGADPNFVFKGNPDPAAAIACKNGDYGILQTIIDNGKCNLEGSNGETLLHIVVREIGKPNNIRCDYKKCFDILLDQNIDSININSVDRKHCTALHYAARGGDEETVTKLLHKGAYIGTSDPLRDPPISEISYKVMKKFLDSCIDTNGARIGEDTFEVIFNYSFLKPGCLSRNRTHEDTAYLMVDHQNKYSIKEDTSGYSPEIDPLLYMSQSDELKGLLKHPVISSFLYLKWYRLTCIFRTNLIFFSLFCLSLILYIMLCFGKTIEDPVMEKLSFCLWSATGIGLCLLMVREFFQMLVSFRNYFLQIENYFEIGLISTSIAILFCNLTDDHTRQQFSAIAILLAAAELMQLIGQLPTFSTNNVMLRTVCRNFFKFFALNSLLIIAFALSFYTLFNDQPVIAVVSNSTSNAPAADGGDPNFFGHPGLALMKTFVMLTGEFDASGIKFDNYPVTSHIIFVLFVFLVTIVLFNLLNGLAISDTQAIKADAECVFLKTRTKLLSYYECILLTDINLCGLILSKINRLFGCSVGRRLISKRIQPFAKVIALFPEYLPDDKIYVKMNQENIIAIPSTKQNYGFCCIFNICQWNKMDKQIIRYARKILEKRSSRDHSDANSEIRLNNIEKKIERIEESIQKMILLITQQNKK